MKNIILYALCVFYIQNAIAINLLSHESRESFCKDFAYKFDNGKINLSENHCEFIQQLNNSKRNLDLGDDFYRWNNVSNISIGEQCFMIGHNTQGLTFISTPVNGILEPICGFTTKSEYKLISSDEFKVCNATQDEKVKFYSSEENKTIAQKQLQETVSESKHLSNKILNLNGTYNIDLDNDGEKDNVWQISNIPEEIPNRGCLTNSLIIVDGKNKIINEHEKHLNTLPHDCNSAIPDILNFENQNYIGINYHTTNTYKIFQYKNNVINLICDFDIKWSNLPLKEYELLANLSRNSHKTIWEYIADSPLSEYWLNIAISEGHRADELYKHRKHTVVSFFIENDKHKLLRQLLENTKFDPQSTIFKEEDPIHDIAWRRDNLELLQILVDHNFPISENTFREIFWRAEFPFKKLEIILAGGFNPNFIDNKVLDYVSYDHKRRADFLNILFKYDYNPNNMANHMLNEFFDGNNENDINDLKLLFDNGLSLEKIDKNSFANFVEGNSGMYINELNVLSNNDLKPRTKTNKTSLEILNIFLTKGLNPEIEVTVKIPVPVEKYISKYDSKPQVLFSKPKKDEIQIKGNLSYEDFNSPNTYAFIEEKFTLLELAKFKNNKPVIELLEKYK